MTRQKLKMAVIPVLGLILLAVLRGSPSGTPEPAAPRARRPEIAIPGAARPATARTRTLEEIAGFDPFRSPMEGSAGGAAAGGAVAVDAAAIRAAPQASLRSRIRIEAIVKRNGSFEAMIGGKPVRAGELIDEGRYRVTAITADNVTFRRTDAGR